MVARPFWTGLIERAWRKTPIVWLSGVRRVGKTTLANELEGALYLNCDLPSVQARLEDIELFYADHHEGRLILDEVHQLKDPSRLLKIGADTRPKLRILATGSSTLAATQKFRDTLAGRKRNLQLLPVLWSELDAFGAEPDTRLLRGGLPPALVGDYDPGFYGEWLDSYYARDVQELFRVEKRAGFLSLLTSLLKQSGGLSEVTHLARLTGLSRPTVMNYLNVLETTHAIRVVRPFHGGSARELLHQPKIYGFDTGFVCFARGWDSLRAEDRGGLWEHLVLETLIAHSSAEVHFWRDKSQREVDFVVPGARGSADAIECKWSASGFSAAGLTAFRSVQPKGKNYLVTAGDGAPYVRDYDGNRVEVVSLPALVKATAS
jgi:predicted AAA+ superfamily ATPase